MTLLDQLDNGMLTPPVIQAVQTIHPEFFAALQGRILQSLPQGKPDPARRLVLSMLLGAPVAGSLRPEVVAAAQQRIARDVAAVQAAPARAYKQARTRQNGEETAAQRLAGR